MTSNETAGPLPPAAAAAAAATATTHLRIARPTDSIQSLLHFYVDGLGFEVKLSFSGHEGFDGVLLALSTSSSSSSSSPSSSSSYHLEFTQHASHRAGRAPTKDNLLVFYMPDKTLHRGAVARMRNAGFEPVGSFNPYWDRCGVTFEDPDGYRVVLANMRSPV